MKNRTNLILKRIVAGILSVLMVAAPVVDTGVQLGMQRMLAQNVAQAASINEGDGSRIENINIQWVTDDSATNCKGEAPESYWASSDENLYVAAPTTDPVAMKYQVEVAFSGQYDYAPGDIVLRIPAQVIHGRSYNADGEGVVDANVYIDQLALPVPQAPSTKAEFNWTLQGDEYVITNTSTVGATSTATFQFTIEHVNPLDVVDMAASDPISARVEVTTNQGNMIYLESTPLYAYVDTYSYVDSAYKTDNNGDLHDGVPVGVPEELLANLPAGTSTSDYVYVGWSSYVYHKGSQPFILKALETESAAYEMNDGNLGNKVADGIFLGWRDASPIATDNEKEIVFFENEYCEDTVQNFEHTIYCWTAYPRSNFEYANEDDATKNYRIINNIDWTVVEADASIQTPAGTDEKEETTVTAQALVDFAPMKWSKPTGHFEVFKYTEVIYDKDHDYGFGLNQLLLGQNTSMRFWLRAVGYGYPWTSHRTFEGVSGEAEPTPEEYGLYGWRQSVEDYQTFFNFDGEKLTGDDYQITTMEVRRPYLYRYGITSTGSCGYERDASLPVPDLKIEYMDADGQWHYAGTLQWGEDGKGDLSMVDMAAGVSTSFTHQGNFIYLPEGVIQTRHTFVSNVFGGETVTPCDVAAVEWDVFDHIELKPSEKVVAIAEKLLEEDDNPSTKFKNDVRMDVDGWVGYEQSPDGLRLNDYDTFYDSSRATLSGTSYSVTMDKNLEYDAVADNDTAAQQATLHYSAKVYEKSNLTDEEEYLSAVANGIIPAETSGIWYDLLPPGVAPKLDTITLRENDTVTSAYTIANYKNTGRILLVVEADLTPVPEETNEGYQDVLTLQFDAVYPWTEARSLGENLINYIAFESKSDLPGGMLGTVENESGEPDNPRGGMNTTTPQWSTEIADAMTDLDPTTDENRFVYSEARNVINVNMYALSGLAKSVSNDLVGLWTQGLDGQDQVTVYEGHKYTYSLKVVSTDQTQTKDIVVYDSIENYDIPDPANDVMGDATKAEDYADRESKKNWSGDWQGKGQWRGTLYQVDASGFAKAGAAPVLYYSTVENLQFGDLGPNPSDAEMEGLISSGYYVLEGNSAWNRVELDESGKWTVPEGVNVTAIAIDASKDAANEDFVLQPGETMTAYLRMVAPDDNGDPEVWNAKGAYAHNEDGTIDWEAAGDAENNMYAFNNARIISTQADAEGIGSSKPKMTRNDYTRVGILPGQVSVEKVWDDNEDHDGLRPDAATVTLMRKPVGMPGDYSTVLDADGAPLTATLEASNEWKHTFLQVDVVDENGTPYLYTFEEEAIDGYTYKVTNNGGTGYIVTNTHKNEMIPLQGQKYWVDGDNASESRPAYIMVNVKRDGTTIKSVQVKPNIYGDWSWDLGEVEKYEAGGREYEYTVEENYVPGYVATYDENSLDIINTYSPFGALEISKTVSGTSSQKAFTFTLLVMDKDGFPLKDSYLATLMEQQDGSWVEVSTTEVTGNCTITLKGNQKLLVEDLPSESTYRVSEGAAAGYTQQSASGATGTIRTGETAQAAFVNAYSASGSISLAATKVLKGGALRKGQFSFQMKDITEGGSGAVYTGFNQAGVDVSAGSDTQSSGAVQFASLSFTGADVGKTFTYELSEVNDGKGGFTYSDAVYTASVTVVDNGDGTLGANVTYKDASGRTVDASEVKFENEYAAEGTTSVMAWKVLNGGTLAADQFEFGLYKQGNSTPVDTAKNNADGEIVFENLHFTSNDLSADPENPAVVTYQIKEIVPATDDDLEYDDTVYTVSITLRDNGDGTIGFEQQYKDATGADAIPVFTNAAKPGNLKVEKHIEGDVVDPDQEFTFKVRFTGEGLPEEIEYELSEATPTTSQLIRERDGLRLFVASAAGGSSAGYYYLSDAEAAYEPVAMLDPQGNLTIMRLPVEASAISGYNEAYTFPVGANGTKVDFAVLKEGTNGSTYTNIISRVEDTETGYVYYKLRDTEKKQAWQSTPTQIASIWQTDKSKIKTVTMTGGLKPLTTSTASMFSGCSNLVSADLSMLDLRAATSMADMFDSCSSLTTVGASTWDTSTITTMAEMFNSCSKLQTVDVSNWNVSSVTTMKMMFNRCSVLPSLNTSNWNTAALTTTESMFTDCAALAALDVTGFDTADVTTMKNMFSGCNSLGDLNMSNWNTALVTDFSNMFKDCNSMMLIDVSSFDTKNGTNFSGMFNQKAIGYGRELRLGSNFNTSKATTSSATRDFIGFYTGTYGTAYTTAICFETITLSNTTIIHQSNNIPDPLRFSPYSGNWACVSNPSKAPLTNSEALLQQGGNGGTWTWEKAGYTLTFLPGDGATGSMADVKGQPTEALTVTNAFKRYGYNFAGFVDETGKPFDVNADGKTVTILANTYSEGTHTLTAQWTKIDTNVEIVDGVLTFTLHGGEAATFPNLPAGTTYEVWEETPTGWELVNSTNTEGTIPSNQTVTSTFYNAYNEEITGVDVVLRASKLMDGEVPEAEQFSFLLTYPDGTTTQTKSNSASGAVVFDAITFDTEGEYEYKITEVKGSDNTIKYDNTTYLATVKVENVDGQLSATVKYKIQYGNQLSAPPVFQNTSRPGTLWISKQVSGAPDVAKDTEFDVQISFTKDNQPWSGTIKQGNTNVVVTDGVCTYKIKGGTTISFNSIPAGLKYEVKEIGTYPGWTLDTDVKTGIIAANVNTFLTFTNTYAAAGSYVISAEKTLNGRPLTEDEFTFGLYPCDSKMGNVDADAQPIQTTTNAADGSIRFSEIPASGAGTFYYVIRELPTDDPTIDMDEGQVVVEVTVEDNGEGRLVPTIEYTKHSEGSSNWGQDDRLFVNEVKPGTIVLDKNVVGASDASDTLFQFTLSFTDAEGNPVALRENNVSINFTPSYQDGREDGGEDFNDIGCEADPDSINSYLITMQDGVRLTLTNVPHGLNYTITEEPMPGYTATSTGATGQVVAGQTNQITFTNTYSASGEYSIRAKKVLEGKELQADQFTFLLMDGSGRAISSATNAADGTVTFAPLYFTLEDVGQKTYKISERDSGVAGYDYDTTIQTVTLTISDNGDGTLNISSDMEDDPSRFSNLYSNETSYTVTKKWIDNSNQYGMRPARISVALKQNGQVMPGYETCWINGDPESDVWEYTFLDLPAFDETTMEPYVYSVEEASVPGYASSKVSSEEGTTITNALLGTLSVTKQVEDDDDTDTFTFKFTFTQNGQPYNEPIQCICDGETVTITPEDGVIEMELMDGQTVQMIGLPIGMEYTVEEESLPLYYATVEGETEGYIQRGIQNITFTNNYSATLDIEKYVGKTNADGEFVTINDDDPLAEQPFTFQLKLTDAQGNPFTRPIGVPNEDYDGFDELIEAVDGVYEFTMYHNDWMGLAGLPYGGSYELTEVDADGFTLDVTEDSAPLSGTLDYSINDEDYIVVIATNSYDATGSLTIPGIKLVDGDVPSEEQVFQFGINIIPAPVGNGGKYGITTGLDVPEMPDLPDENDWEIEFVGDEFAAVVENIGAVIEFGEIVFHDAATGSYCFEIFEVPDNSNAYTEDTVSYYVEVDVGYPKDANGNDIYDGTLEATITKVTDSFGADIGAENIVFNNISNNVTAEFEKLWVNADESTTAPTGATVELKLLVNEMETDKTVTLDGTADTAPTGSAIAGYEVAPWKAKFVNLPKKVNVENNGVVSVETAEYTVTESTGYEGYTASVSEDGKTITNTQDVGSLKITKEFSGLPTGADVDGLSITISDGTSETTITYADFTDGKYVLENIPVGTEFTVTETNAEGLVSNYTLTADSVTEGIATIEKDTEATIALVNAYEQDLGSLVVSKEVESYNSEHSNKAFAFNVTLTDTSIDGTYGDITFNDGVASVSLKDGESAEATGLPAGVGYTVTEAGVAGFTATSTGASGTIEDGVSAEASFTNTYNLQSVTASFPVKKELTVPQGMTAGSIADKFTFTLSAASGVPMPTTVSKTNPAADGGTVTFGPITYTQPGTYTYTVTESGSADGVTNDATSAKTVTVTVIDNDDGTMTATPSSTTDDPLTFTNEYDVEDVSATIEVSKTLTGRELAAEEFSFSLKQGSTVVATATNDAQGKVTFDPITYTVPGTYTYTLTEDEGSLGGITYDEHEVIVTVQVTDNGDGEMSATITYSGSKVFANTYKAEPTTASFPVKKELAVPEGLNAGSIADKFTFTLTAADGAPMPETTSHTNPDADGGTVTFGAITFSEVGTYTYTVTESGSADGVTNDSTAAKTVTVTVSDNGDGTLKAVASSTTDEPLTFTNSYSVEPTTASFPVKKELMVPAGLTAGSIKEKFTFTVTAADGTPMPTTTSQKNPAADGGTVTFSGMEYTMPGTYTYTVTETGSADGVTNDSTAAKTVTVTVSDNGDGTLKAEASSTTAAPLTFTNTYSVEPTTASFPVKKELSVPEGLTAGSIKEKFTFELTAGAGVPMPEVTSVKNPDADGGVVSFGDIEYVKPGTYTYTVTEKGSAAGVTNDATKAKTVTVTVSDNGDGTLKAEASSTTAAPLTFTNSYSVQPVKASFPVKKVLTVPEGLEANSIAGKFTFKLTAATGTPLPTTTTYTNPDANGGVVNFGEIEYVKPGIYTYTITESGSADGVTNDATAAKTVTVTVTDNGDGTLKAEASSTTAAPLTFTNTYSVDPITASFPVKKELEVPEGLTAGSIKEKFTFTVTAADGTPMPSTTSLNNPAADGGTVTFSGMEYTMPGTYTYTVTETGSAGGVTNDAQAAKTVTVTVTDNGDGTLKAEASSTTAAPLTFTNTYSVEPTTASFPVKKVLEVPEGLSAGSIAEKFTFTVTAASGTPMPSTTSQKNPAADGGTVTFSGMEFTEPGTYTYTVTETGSADGVTNDATAAKTVTVTVTDNGDGTLKAEASSTTAAPLTFTNSYSVEPTTASFPVKKELEVPEGLSAGSIAGKFTFKLTAADGVPMPSIKSYTNPDANGGVVTFSDIEYTKPGTYTYTVTETGSAGGVTNDATAAKTVTVTVSDNGDGTLKAEASSTTAAPLTFTNSYSVKPITASFPVKKELTVPEGLTAGSIKEKFTFTVTAADGTPMPTTTSQKNPAADGGTVTFSGMEYTMPGTYTYTVTETGSAGGVTNDATAAKTVTVTVTDNGDGTLKAEASSTTAAPLTFTNSYSVKPVKASFPVKKVLYVPENLSSGSIAGKFTFTLTADEGVPMPETTSYTNPDADGGVVTFSDIEYVKPGTYTYTVTETGSAAGVTNDATAAKKVRVVVTDNGDGTLKAVPSSTDTAPLSFTNTYGVVPANAMIEATKILTGRDLAEGEFTFTLLDEDGNVAGTAVNDAEGKVIFDAISYVAPGTYEYTLSEDEGELGGVEYDGNEVAVTVSVTDNGDGTLDAAVSYGSDAVFTNVYTTLPVDATIKATKTLQGRNLAEGEFSFDLKLNGEVVDTATNAEDGSITFDAITYTEPGKHTYTITEAAGNLGGVTYDSNEVTVTVTVTDNGDGTLKAEVEYDGDAEFVNSYAAYPTSVEFAVYKQLFGREMAAGEFTFLLTDAHGDVVATSTNDVDGQVVFGGISFTEAGEYTFTVSEQEGDLGGVVYDRNSYEVRVTVVDDGNGHLSAKVYTGGEIFFKNIYEAEGEIIFKGTKTIEGRALTENDVFTFEVFDSADLIATGANDITGNITFQPIKFHLSGDPHGVLGVHEYIVYENGSDAGGITVDTVVYSVAVNVTDNGDGTLAVTPMDGYDDPMALAFVNIYEAETTVEFEATKTLTGRTLKDGQFQFELSGTDMETKIVTNGADGSIVFDPIHYTQDDAGKIFTYELKEINGGVEGYTYDDTVYTIQVKVTDDGKGNLTAKVTGIPEDGLKFANTYKAESKLSLSGVKTVNGAAPAEDEDALFSFRLLDVNDVPLQTVQNSGGTFTFEDLVYTEADVGKTFRYKVIESDTTGSGYTLDKTAYQFIVKVLDNGNGTLKLDVTGLPEDGFVFDNKYEAEGELVLNAEKLVNGKTPTADLVFDFELVAEDGTVLQTKQNVGESIVFDAITYTLEDVGQYTYTVREATTSDERILADATVYTVTVNVSDLRNGELGVDVAYAVGGEPADAVVFRNMKYAPLTIVKTVEGRTTDTVFPFIVNLYDADGNEYTEPFTYTIVDANGQQVGEEQTLVSGGHIGLKSGESAIISNTLPGTKYTVQEVENMAYTVTMNGESGNVAVGIIEEDGSTVTCVNTPKVTSISVTKEWEGGYGDAIELVLYANGVKLASQPVCKQEGSTYTYINLPMYSDDGTLLTYSIKEKYMDGFVTIYKNVGAHENETDRVYDGGTIVNRAVTSIKVRKVWNGLADDSKKPEITLTLYCNGEKMGRATPKPDHNGWYEFKNLPVVRDGKLAVYTVVEEPMAGYTATYFTPDGQEAKSAANGYTIINIKVPDTGDHTPVGMLSTLMLISGGGLVLLGVGLMLSKRKKRS